jgi:hypothetical protein
MIAIAALTSCSDDDPGPLSDDQLPGEVVATESSGSGVPSATLCPELTRAQQEVVVSDTTADEDRSRYWSYRLDDGTWVAVTVAETGYPYEDTDDALAAVEDAIMACTDDDVAPLDDVPEGTVGYSSTRTDSNGTSEGETLVATAGDRVVMVAATHDRGAEPSVDVRDLLSDVRESAADLDLS